MAGSTSTIQWSPDAVMRRLEEAVLVGLGNAGQVMHRRAVDVVGDPWPPPSEPGEPPHKRSGDLQDGLTVWVEKIPGGGIVHMGWKPGSPAHAEFLARGTSRMDARPALPVVLADRRNDVVQTIAESVRRALR